MHSISEHHNSQVHDAITTACRTQDVMLPKIQAVMDYTRKFVHVNGT